MSSAPGSAEDIFEDDVAAAVAQHLSLAPAASMAELAAAAGVSRATLFRRFPSRAALVTELCDAAAQAYVRAVEAADTCRGPADRAWARVVEELAALAPAVGLLGLQPLADHVEAALLEDAAETEDQLRRLVRRGQESGHFRVDVDPEWALALLTWSLVAAADSVRLGRLTPTSARRHLLTTLTTALVRSPTS